MIVVDANILVYRMIECEKTGKVMLLEDRDPDWRFPALWEYEFGNALTLMVRQKKMADKEASILLNTALEVYAPGVMAVNPESALRLATHHQLTFYDSQYLALARTLGASLVTEDKALIRAGAGTAMSLEEILA